MAITSEIGDRLAQVSSLTNLGNAYRNLGDAQRAFEYYNQALEIAHELGDRRSEALVLNNMGSTYSKHGEMEQAIEHHTRALEILRQIGDRRSQGDCLTNLGFIYMRRHETERAFEVCQQAIRDSPRGRDMSVSARVVNMANLFAQQTGFAKRFPMQRMRAQILEKVGHTEKAPQARKLVDDIRKELDLRTSKEEVSAKPTPPEIQQQILKFRRDNPQSSANMSDDEIILLFLQADLSLEHSKPMTFLVRIRKRCQNQWINRIRMQCLPLNVGHMASNCCSKAAGQKPKNTF